jgi:predicted lipoprotein
MKSLSVFATLALLATCKPPAQPSDNFDRGAMLVSIADNVILPALQDAQAKSAAFVTAAHVFAGSPLSDQKTAAQAAWRSLMNAWQRLEVMQVGPMVDPAQSASGQGIRDSVYVWPVVDACAIDQAVAAQGYAAQDFFATAGATKDLGAAEYLLFRTDGADACATGTTLTPTEREQRHATYLAAIADHVASQAQALLTAWGSGGYRASFVASGQDGVNVAFEAIFVGVELVKDKKLARPAGVSTVCGKGSCPELAEGLWSQSARASLRVNLETIAAALQGGSGLGFDDFLIARGADALSSSLLDKVTAAQTSLAALTGGEAAPLLGPSGEDVDAVRGIYDDVKAIADLMKTQMLSVLNLRMPTGAAGDND